MTLAVGARPLALPQRILGRDLFWWLTRLGMLDRPADSPLARRMRERGDLVIGGSLRRLRAAGVDVRPRVAGASESGPTFADGSSAAPASVVWATGFRADYSWIDVPGVVGADGAVRHRRGVTDMPGLYFIGLPWQHTRGSALLGTRLLTKEMAFPESERDAFGLRGLLPDRVLTIEGSHFVGNDALSPGDGPSIRGGAVNIGGAGTFVIRRPVSRALLRAEITRRLPFETEVMICEGTEILRLVAHDPFPRQAARPDIVRFVSILARRPHAGPRLPVTLPARGPWLLKVLALNGRFVIGMYRRHMKVIGYLGRLDRLFGVAATTRNVNGDPSTVTFVPTGWVIIEQGVISGITDDNSNPQIISELLPPV